MTTAAGLLLTGPVPLRQTDQLQEGAVRFNTGAKKLKFALWRKNMLLIIGIVVVAIVAVRCGFFRII